MIFGMTYYEICWYFLIYSFIGWMVEVIYHAVSLGKIINRGFLNGPLCPVYGFGVLAVFSFANTMEAGGAEEMHPLLLYLGGVLLATAIELIAGWLLDILFHARWWDYSNKPLNFHGYICLEFSLIWGLAIVFVVRVLQSFVEEHAARGIPETYGWYILLVLYLIALVDLIVTVAIVRGMNKKLRRLDDLRASLRIVSDGLSERIGENSILAAQKIDEGKVQAALAKAELKDATEEWRDLEEWRNLEQALLGHSLFGSGRLLRAFPEMKHKKYPEVISQLKQKMVETGIRK